MPDSSTLVDRVKIFVESSGTGPFQLGNAVPSFRGSEALIDGLTYSYAVESGSDYEVGQGVYVLAVDQLIRSPTLSSAGGAPVNFPANVTINFTALAADLVAGLAGSGTVTSVQGNGGTTGLTLTGGPITGAGTLTLGGVLGVANGGTSGTTGAEARAGIGLGNVDNTSDANKPISTDTQTALNAKVSLAALAAPTGGGMVGFSQTGANAIETDVLVKARQNVADRDFTTGLVGALTAVRNNDDTSFSGGVSILNGITDISAPIALPQTFARVCGNGGGTYRQLDAEPIFDGSAASHVGNSFDNFRTYNGTHVFDISTVGEVASNNYTCLSLVAFTGDAWRFSGGVTSCLFANCSIDATNGDHGIYSGGGNNNDNVVQNIDFTNLTKPAVKFLNTANGLWVNYCRVEGNGQAGEAVFDLVGASGVRITCGWYEGHHDHLLKLSGSSSGGVTIDGIVDIGAKNGGGFKASTFDVGSNLVNFGTNYWANLTTAPLNVLIYGLNDNLSLGASNVKEAGWTHRGGTIHLKRRDRSVDGATFDLLTFTRPASTPNDFTNLQIITGVLTVSFVGADGGGVTRTISRSYPVQVYAAGSGTMTVGVGTAYNIIENAGAVTITPQAKAGASATAATLEVVLASVNASFNSLFDATFEFGNNTNLASNPITVAAA